VASLTAHLTAGPEHGRLGFHPLCPRCRDERLAGSLDRELLVSRRAQAVVAAGVLAVSTAAPAVSVAAEPDQEQEGGAVPAPDADGGGTLDDPGFDPGGADTPLEVDTGAPSGGSEAGGDLDDGTDPAPVEPEEQDDPDGRLVLDEQPAEADPTDVDAAPSAPTESDVSEQTPEPQLAAPESPGESGRLLESDDRRHEPSRRIVLTAPAQRNNGSPPPAVVTSSPPTPVVQAAVDTTTATTAETVQISQGAGRTTVPVRGDSYRVREGDSLWTIARRVLGSDASNGQVAREVNRLWRLNEERIGTGDPSLLNVGTLLKLR
jgi:nucleoid-associated protein YgaU